MLAILFFVVLHLITMKVVARVAIKARYGVKSIAVVCPSIEIE
jgi:hypothetical protein